MSQPAEEGSTVLVHYTGRLEDGTVFDSSRDGNPIEFEVGSEEVIDGFDQAVRGMEQGETREATLGPDEAYGERREDLIFDIPREELPEQVDPSVGQELSVEIESGREVPAYVAEVDEDTVTLDLNHPLAGKALSFEIEVVEVR